MPSPCVDNLLKPLTVSRPHSPFGQLTQADGPGKDISPALRSILLSLNKPLSQTLVNETIGSLVQLGRDFSTTEENFEEIALNQAILTKLVVGLYAEGLDLCLTQAANAEAEAEWWRDVEYSRRNAAWYLLQTLPSRLLRVGRVVVEALRSHNIPITLANLSPSSLRQLFPSAGALRPNLLMTACFPHLQHQPFSITSSLILYSSEHDVPHENFLNKVSAWLNYVLSLIKMPVELTRQECMFKRRELESLRDQKAEVLGRLAQMRGDLAAILRDQPWNLQSFVFVLNATLRGEADVEYKPSLQATQSGSAGALLEIAQYSKTVFESQASDYNQRLNVKQLLRPSRLTLLWPKLVLVPPLTFYALRSAYSNRASIWDVARDAQDTARGFVKGWLVEPLKDVLKTVRAGGEDAMIIRKEGVNADFESLERMALALAKDELHYGPEQLAVMSAHIKQGDLTPILHLYEEDIKRPLTSALSGTLLRSVFIQVQKAKVDIDQALAGIDKLLRSQELTFAFVGVAPAFAIVYVLGTSLVSLWSGGRGKGKYGGRKNIGRVWYALRRTERLIVSQPGAHHNDSRDQDQNLGVHNAHDHSDSAISPATAGLLLLSATRLRTYAERHLPARSRLREGFLEDVGDLENPDLGRSAKMRVVERMWRCWGEVLALGSAGAEGASSR